MGDGAIELFQLRYQLAGGGLRGIGLHAEPGIAKLQPSTCMQTGFSGRRQQQEKRPWNTSEHSISLIGNFDLPNPRLRPTLDYEHTTRDGKRSSKPFASDQ